MDLLKGTREPGNRTLIVGGGLAGCEVAIWLAQMGKKAILVEMLPELMAGGAPVPIQVKMMTLDLLKKFGVEVHTGSEVQEITPEGTALICDDQSSRRIQADTVVLSIGMTPNAGLADGVEEIGIPTYRIGDCRVPKNIMNAVWDAYEIARFI